MIKTLALLLHLAQFNPETGALCLEREAIEQRLRSSYGEIKLLRGLTQDDSFIVEIYVSPNGSWTIIGTTPAGCSFILGAGKGMVSTVPLKGKLI